MDLVSLSKIALFISILLTSGVYLTGHVDERQYTKFGYRGARFLILTYAFVYSFINSLILQ